MSRNLSGRLMVASATLALAACGGGGGTYVASTPPPMTTPAPPPAPFPPIFPNVTTTTQFAALGLELPNAGTPASSLVGDGFSVRFDAANNAYYFSIPNGVPQPAPFSSGSQDNSFWYGTIAGQPRGDGLAVFKPSVGNPDFQLSYTSFGIANGYYSNPLSFIAFGQATPTSGIPPTGSASYDAYVVGETTSFNGGEDAFRAGTDPLFYHPSIGGSATLQFDFGAGTLAGHFDPTLTSYDGANQNYVTSGLGTYNFTNVVYGVGHTGFSGQLSHFGTSSLGAFDGQFTGPVAQELMARWTAPYLNPSTQLWGQMFGVWVGRKH